VQLVIGGKAHPADDGGKRLIQELVRFADDPEVRHRIVFLPDYDIAMATILYPGCDVWLNNPIRPLEASGTSGMKAALNGALNLSILDGWWDEWYDGENGWAIPTADGVEDSERRDDLEAAALYDLIEREVAPTFYQQGDDGLPHRWIERVRHTLMTLGPKVLASRMVSEYVMRLYEPAAISSRRAAADDFALARGLAAWKSRVEAAWDGVAVEHVEAMGVGDAPSLGAPLHLRAHVRLGDLAPEDVLVQVVFGRVDSDDRLVAPAYADLRAEEGYDGSRWLFSGDISLASTGPFGYTVRVLPRHEGMVSPVEMGLIAAPAMLAAANEPVLR
jgi:starch phosphorylase